MRLESKLGVNLFLITLLLIVISCSNDCEIDEISILNFEISSKKVVGDSTYLLNSFGVPTNKYLKRNNLSVWNYNGYGINIDFTNFGEYYVMSKIEIDNTKNNLDLLINNNLIENQEDLKLSTFKRIVPCSYKAAKQLANGQEIQIMRANSDIKGLGVVIMVHKGQVVAVTVSGHKEDVEFPPAGL